MKTINWQMYAVSSGLFLIGLVMAIGAKDLPSDSGYQGVGANFFPWVVSFALMACGILLLIQTYWGKLVQSADEAPPPPNWVSFIFISAALLLNAALITHIGFVISCALTFTFAAKGLRISMDLQRNIAKTLRDFGVGFILALSVYLLFTKLLSIQLPSLIQSGLLAKWI